MKKLILIFILLFTLIGCTSNKNIENKNNSEIKKPQLLLWGATWCGHCQKAIPVFENEIYNVYSGSINIVLNTVSEDNFTTNIPQIQDKSSTFESVSGEKCELIPSWLILDENGKIVMKSCGNEKDIVDMKVTIDNMKTKLKDF